MHVYGWNKIPDLLEIFILMWCQLNFNPQDKQTILAVFFQNYFLKNMSWSHFTLKKEKKIPAKSSSRSVICVIRFSFIQHSSRFGQFLIRQIVCHIGKGKPPLNAYMRTGRCAFSGQLFSTIPFTFLNRFQWFTFCCFYTCLEYRTFRFQLQKT